MEAHSTNEGSYPKTIIPLSGLPPQKTKFQSGGFALLELVQKPAREGINKHGNLFYLIIRTLPQTIFLLCFFYSSAYPFSLAHHISFYVQYLCPPLAIKVHFDLFKKITEAPGIVFYRDNPNRIRRHRGFVPIGHCAATGGSHIINNKRLPTEVAKAKLVAHRFVTSNITKIKRIRSQPFNFGFGGRLTESQYRNSQQNEDKESYVHFFVFICQHAERRPAQASLNH